MDNPNLTMNRLLPCFHRLHPFGPKSALRRLSDAAPPYYRIRHEPRANRRIDFSRQVHGLDPARSPDPRGVIVHQHGCGEGSCKSGLTGAWDSPASAGPQARLRCLPLLRTTGQGRLPNVVRSSGSGKAFQQGLKDLGQKSGHRTVRSPRLVGTQRGGHWGVG